jgi:AraC-like DNA-binding protein
LQRVRIERAKKFLATTTQKVETVALDSGYQSINSFCVAFKRAVGMSAKQFREKMQR